MKKIKRILIIILIASLVFGSGGFLLPFRALSANFHIKISGPNKVVAGGTYKITISITNDAGNIVPSAENSVGVVLSRGVSGIPAFFKFSSGNKGTRTFDVKFTKGGIAEIKVFDLNTPEVFAKYEVFVSKGPVTDVIIEPKEITVYPGEVYKFNVKFNDAYGNSSKQSPGTIVEVDNIKGSAYGKYIGDGKFVFSGEGECQVVFKNGNTFTSANVFVAKSKRDYLFVGLEATNTGFRHNSGYKITVKNGRKLIEKGDLIKLYFPVSVLFPCPCHKKIINTDIVINGKPLLGNPSLSCDGFWHILGFKSVFTINPYDTFTIYVKESAGILNPMRDDKFLVGVSVSPYPYMYYSNYQKIGNLIDTPKLYAFPSFTRRNSDFVFVFHTLKGFSLKKGAPLGLVFPYGSFLPDFPNASNFSINGYVLWKGSVVTKWNQRTYVITLPFDLSPGETVIVNVSKNAGITLPPYEGYYNGGVIYNFSILTVKSIPLYVSYKPLLKVKAILPENHSSVKGLYNFEPQVSFSADSTYGFVKTAIMYSIDNSKEFLPYEKPFTVKGEGMHTIRYYAVNTLGLKTNTKNVQVYIDTVAPEITLKRIIDLGKNKKKYIFGSNEVLSSVYVNGYYTICGFDKEFYVTLSGKAEKLIVEATDLAGNTKEKVFKP